jgi:hypothetical protein
MSRDTSIESSGTTALRRFAPLAGLLFAGLTMAGDLTIGPFPDGSTPATDLPAYYAAHGHQVALGGTLLSAAGLCFAIFAASVWARLSNARVPLVVTGLVVLGAAVDTMDHLHSGAVYHLLGDIGLDEHVSVGALQAWHISGSEFGVGGGGTLFLLGVAVAGIGYRALPRWLAWTGLALGIGLFSPWAFLASMVVLLWAAAAGITLVVRPGRTTRHLLEEPTPVS